MGSNIKIIMVGMVVIFLNLIFVSALDFSLCETGQPMTNGKLASLIINHFPDGIVPQTGENIRVTAYSIARAESDGNPTGCGDIDYFAPGTASVGIFQINTYWNSNLDSNRLFDPDYNAEIARINSNGGTDWNLWCTFEKTACGGSGIATYRNFINEAKNALNITPLINCRSNTDCNDNNALTIDTCNNPGTINSICSHQTIACVSNSNCNDNNALTIDTCNNPGTINSFCTHQTATIACFTNLDCGTNVLIGNPYCKNQKYVMQDRRIFVCNNPGTVSSSCSSYKRSFTLATCSNSQICFSGACVSKRFK